MRFVVAWRAGILILLGADGQFAEFGNFGVASRLEHGLDRDVSQAESRFSLPSTRTFCRHHLPPVGETSRYSPRSSKSLIVFPLDLALRTAVLVRGINGGNSFSVEPSCPQCCPQLPPDAKRRDCPSVDDKSMKKPAFTLTFGCCWLFLDDEMVDAEGIEPSTCRLRVECSAN